MAPTFDSIQVFEKIIIQIMVSSDVSATKATARIQRKIFLVSKLEKLPKHFSR